MKITLCGVVEVRGLADADGFPCRRTASNECFDCGVELCSDHAEQCGMCRDVFPIPLHEPMNFRKASALDAALRGTR
jgi:hypothetical protein